MRDREMLPMVCYGVCLRVIAAHLGIVSAVCLSAAAFADPPASVSFTYDDADRLVLGTLSDGKQVGYQYDAAGNRISLALGTSAQLGIAAASAIEGNSIVFTVTKTGTATDNITVQCTQVSGTAVAGTDFTVSTQTLLFLPADTAKNCTVPTVQDTVFEQNQTFSAVLQNATGQAVITTAGAIGTIVDDDPAPTIAIAPSTAPEGNALVFTLTRTGSTDLQHSVNFSTSDGTATVAGADYTPTSGTKILSPATATATITVPTTSDTIFENPETITLTLSSPTNGAVLGSPASVIGTLGNDDPPPAFAINSPVAVNEGTSITFTVTRSGNPLTEYSHAFAWTTADGTALAPADYTSGSGTLTFLPADVTKTIVVPTITDGVVDGSTNETFTVTLSPNGGTNGGLLSAAVGTGTIVDINAPIAPSVPGNLRTNPAGQSNASGGFSVQWDASSGPVAYYTLDELDESQIFFASWQITAPTLFKTFSNHASGDRYYRVKACSASNQCSAYTPVRYILICNGACQ